MKISFLGQGYEPESNNSVGNYLLKFLSQTNFHSFIGISAFASEAGIFGLSNYIQAAKEHFKNLVLIVGIDQEGTSKEALEEILALNICSYIFYQEESTIFHPKIYLFEGDNEVKLIVGSSNLTGRGLFSNVESSLLVEFDTNDLEGITLISELKTYYQSLFELTDANLFMISHATIDDFVAKGIVPKENERRLLYTKMKKTEHDESHNSSAYIKIPRRTTAKIPLTFLRKNKKIGIEKTGNINVVTEVVTGGDNQLNQESILVWESGPLTERDLNIPKGTNTNPTGSMGFKKGKTEGIDQRHYFRDVVFSNLDWKYDTRKGVLHLERALVTITLIIENTNYGKFNLIITHNTRTDTRAYEQKNSMTSISWGEAKKIIAKEELIGKSASLYKNKDNREFILVVE